MAITKAVAYCRIDDSFAAGKAAIEAVMQKLDGQSPDFLLLFTTVGHDIEKVLKGIQAVAPDIPLCGCSGSGTITNLGCDEATHSVALMGLQSNQVRFHPFLVSGLSTNALEVGKQIGETIQSLGLSEAERKLLFLFPDGITVKADDLFNGIKSVVTYDIDFAGGTAGNDYSYSKTYQFCNQEILSDAVSGVLISGDFEYVIGVSHGCKPIGNYKTVTKVQDNVIYEIDGKPALELLKSSLGTDLSSDIWKANLLGLGQSFEGKNYSEDIIIRGFLGFDEENGGIKIGAQMPVGALIRFTRRDKVKVKKGTKIIAEKVIEQIKTKNAAYFYFNCMSRGSYLFDESNADVDVVQEVLGADSDLIGFFAFGEIAPVSGTNYFHNHTGVLVALQ